LANVLFIEAPVGVGFSYATDPQRYHIGDTGTAIDNYRLLQGTQAHTGAALKHIFV
jgi:carboxypeptidase C (cathepsin A)